MSMHAGEKSDEVVVPLKRPNNGSSLPAEAVEGRTSPKGNSRQAATVRARSRVAVSPGLAAVRRAARQSTSVRFTSLLHHLTVELLERSYFSLKRNSAPGIDGVTWRAYGENLDEKLTELHAKIHRGGLESHWPPSRADGDYASDPGHVSIPSVWLSGENADRPHSHTATPPR